MEKVLVLASVLLFCSVFNGSNGLNCIFDSCYMEKGVCKSLVAPQNLPCINGKCYKIEGNFCENYFP